MMVAPSLVRQRVSSTVASVRDARIEWACGQLLPSSEIHTHPLPKNRNC